ncbi:excinuclease ATPase subunit [Arenimonas sp.]|uniref:excinuclease ATPase subunit n=1 Tax=Arenimonas sp. TaxID=1872635 RepID=UPI0035ADA504
MKNLVPIFLFAVLAASTAQARDTRLHLDFAEAVKSGLSDGTLDGSVSFHLAGAPTPAISKRLGVANSNRKTNAVNKSDEEACRWVLMSVLLAMQDQARSRGANAVVDITSNYKKQEFSSPTQYECAAGAIMAGVALKGTYATVSR